MHELLTPPSPDHTPCRGLCAMGENNACSGCLRTRLEVASWFRMSTQERREVWERITRAGYFKLADQGATDSK